VDAFILSRQVIVVNLLILVLHSVLSFVLLITVFSGFVYYSSRTVAAKFEVTAYSELAP